MEEHVLIKAKHRMEKELSDILDKQTLNANDLETMTKIVCSIKDIEKSLEIEGYNDEYSGRMTYPYSYGSYPMRGRSNNSYERGRSVRTGRYMSRGDEYMDGNYSGHSVRDRMVDRLEQMYDEAASDHERSIIDKWIKKIEHEV